MMCIAQPLVGHSFSALTLCSVNGRELGQSPTDAMVLCLGWHLVLDSEGGDIRALVFGMPKNCKEEQGKFTHKQPSISRCSGQELGRSLPMPEGRWRRGIKLNFLFNLKFVRDN